MVHRWAGSQCEVCSGNQGLADGAGRWGRPMGLADGDGIECMPCTATAPDRRVGVEALHCVVRGIAQLRQQLAPDLEEVGRHLRQLCQAWVSEQGSSMQVAWLETFPCAFNTSPKQAR